MTTDNILLKVPFNEKDQAKALGARWNAEAKHWYVPKGVESIPFEKWFNTAGIMPKNTANVSTSLATEAQPLGDDMDAINAKLRDAYELRSTEEI